MADNKPDFLYKQIESHFENFKEDAKLVNGDVTQLLRFKKDCVDQAKEVAIGPIVYYGGNKVEYISAKGSGSYPQAKTFDVDGCRVQSLILQGNAAPETIKPDVTNRTSLAASMGEPKDPTLNVGCRSDGGIWLWVPLLMIVIMRRKSWV